MSVWYVCLNTQPCCGCSHHRIARWVPGFHARSKFPMDPGLCFPAPSGHVWCLRAPQRDPNTFIWNWTSPQGHHSPFLFLKALLNFSLETPYFICTSGPFSTQYSSVMIAQITAVSLLINQKPFDTDWFGPSWGNLSWRQVVGAVQSTVKEVVI